jgi:hypothetical protein
LRVVDAADQLVAGADIAADIPAAEFRSRLLLVIDRHVGGLGACNAENRRNRSRRE